MSAETTAAQAPGAPVAYLRDYLAARDFPVEVVALSDAAAEARP